MVLTHARWCWHMHEDAATHTIRHHMHDNAATCTMGCHTHNDAATRSTMLLPTQFTHQEAVKRLTVGPMLPCTQDVRDPAHDAWLGFRNKEVNTVIAALVDAVKAIESDKTMEDSVGFGFAKDIALRALDIAFQALTLVCLHEDAKLIRATSDLLQALALSPHPEAKLTMYVVTAAIVELTVTLNTTTVPPAHKTMLALGATRQKQEAEKTKSIASLHKALSLISAVDTPRAEFTYSSASAPRSVLQAPPRSVVSGLLPTPLPPQQPRIRPQPPTQSLQHPRRDREYTRDAPHAKTVGSGPPRNLSTSFDGRHATATALVSWASMNNVQGCAGCRFVGGEMLLPKHSLYQCPQRQRALDMFDKNRGVCKHSF